MATENVKSLRWKKESTAFKQSFQAAGHTFALERGEGFAKLEVSGPDVNFVAPCKPDASHKMLQNALKRIASVMLGSDIGEEDEDAVEEGSAEGGEVTTEQATEGEATAPANRRSRRQAEAQADAS